MVIRTHSFTDLLQYKERDRYFGGLVGLLVGDAMGVPWEFQPASRLPPHHLIEMAPPQGFYRSHRNILPGTWSDDGAQALCLLASLIENKKFSIEDFSQRLLKWRDHGYMAVDGHVFDIGLLTDSALDRLNDGTSPYESGGREDMDNGNGSLMRVLPLAIWHQGSDEELVWDAHLQSLPTHAHPRSMVACAFYCLVARGYMNNHNDPWNVADERLASIYRSMRDRVAGDRFLEQLFYIREFGRSHSPCGTGYVIDTLWSVRQAMQEGTFEDVVRTAILFGNDTDTTAAVAGGLAGIRFGLKGIPSRWLSQLRGASIFAPLTMIQIVT